MIVLGIETSCDETAAAVVTADRRILADEVFSQIEDHRPFGGVVPEVAARAHLELIDGVVEAAMEKSGVTLDDLDGVAVTGGPGLIGGVLVGVMTAKAIAVVKKKPFIAVNHLEGHALTARLTDDLDFPYLLLLVSGGHCQMLIVEGVGQYKRLGTTIDDALGEAFDKTAKMLGLGFPGGPAVEKAAAMGNGERFPLPRPLKGRPGADFSFSGLKTKVRQTIEGLPKGPLQDQDVADLCASFQAAVEDVLVDRVSNALEAFQAQCPGPSTMVVAGGVGANAPIRKRLGALAAEKGLRAIPPYHPWLIEGVGTYALEFLAAEPDLDIVYVPIGMGSGISGLIAARDGLGLTTKIVGVVAENAPCYALSIEAGHPVSTNTADTIADGMACRVPDAMAFDVIQRGVERIVKVSDAEILAAMGQYFTDTHNVAEGAGAAPLAALLSERERMAGRKVGLILSGGNADKELFSKALG